MCVIKKGIEETLGLVQDAEKKQERYRGRK
jgi:hypothetical protein